MIRKTLIGLALVVALAIGAVIASSLWSLDWGYRHTNETAALPRFDGHTNGLVRIPANGMEFRARVAGIENQGPGVILLHGFPESSIMWEPLTRAGAERGYRMVAVDQRGYSPGARPSGIDAYLYPELVSDVLAIADATGFERFHLVGHDWGCVVGWGVASQNPDRVISYTAMAIPHPLTLVGAMQTDMPTYIQIFNVPGLAETMFSFGNMRIMRNAQIPESNKLETLAIFSEPGALTATLNWYRGILQSIDSVGSAFDGQVDPPVLFIWGSKEFFVNDDVRERQRPYVRSLEELELEGGHTIILDQPAAVVAATLGHIASADGSALEPTSLGD